VETIGSKQSYTLTWCMPNNDDDDGWSIVGQQFEGSSLIRGFDNPILTHVAGVLNTGERSEGLNPIPNPNPRIKEPSYYRYITGWSV